MLKTNHNPIVNFYQTADGTRQVSQTDEVRVRHLLPLFEPGRSDAFLDIGCYDGRKTELLTNLLGAKRVCGIDFLSERLEQASRRGIEAKQFDLNAGLPIHYEEQTFDFIFVGDVIEHIFSPDHLLQEIARLLRPGGYAILTTPNLASWRNRLVLLLGWQPFMTEVSTQYKVGNPLAPGGLPSGHIRMFTPRALRELPAKYNLVVEYLGGQILPNAPVGWVGRASHLVDQLCFRYRSTLCDELVIKLRKK